MTASRFMMLRNTAGAFLTLLAFGVAWPSSAQAGCSHLPGSVPGRGVANLELLAMAGALSSPIDDTAPRVPRPRCSGMHCSNPSAPAPPVVPPVSRAAEQWGNLSDLSSGPDITSSPFPYDDIAIQPCRGGVSPFHPPR